MCGILTLFFLFYFNRLFATLVSYGLRAYTWHKFRVYVDIQALQISLLGGRIFFKGVRYHGENETLLIQNGYITWNYWLQAVKQADCARFASRHIRNSAGSNGKPGSASPLSDAEPNAKETGAIKAAQDLPSRISVSVSGFEWFIYNRSPAYEVIAASQALKPEKELAQPSAADVLCEPDSMGTKQKDSPQGSWNGTQQLKQLLTRLSTKSTSGDFSTLAASETRRQSVQDLHGHGCENSETKPTSEGEAPIASAPSSNQDAPSNTSPLLLTLFPILIECQKGAIIIGNENTRTILTTSFERSRGHIDAAKSGSRDIYRQIFEFEVTHPVVQMKPNPDYRQPQQAAAQNIIRNATSVPNKKMWWKFDWRFHHRKRKALHSLRTLMPYFRSSVESFRPSSVDPRDNTGTGNWPIEIPGESRWLGLSRYLDDDERDDHEGWSNVEYARFSNIVDCPSVHLTFYWDVPGRVRQDLSRTERANGDYDINLAKPPAYGLDLIVRGGTINYGPWADRARAEIQSVFFPNSYQDAVPAATLSAGSLRQSTVLSINVHIENETTLVLPTKENSKDWQWKGRAGALRGVSGIKQRRDKKSTKRRKDDKDRLGPDVRPFGWFAVSVLPNSTISYNMDMVARMRGYHNELELDLKGTKMTTSVNHALLWSCGPQKISCNLSNPLGWNALHEWVFDIRNHGMELFLLRDHMFLLVDLISDLTSGPSSDYLAFVPFIYRIKLSFTDIKLHLSANDSNIIDSPCDVDENTFLILHGETLDVSLDIPLEFYAPSDSNVTFQASARDAQLNLATPTWNTAHTFASAMPTATLKDFSMDGYYNYCSSTSPNLTDSLFLNLRGFSPKIFLHGSLIKYCIKLKDNYFGDDVHFRTLEEFQEILQKQKNVDTEPAKFHNKKDNDLDVILNVTFERVCAILPANLYSRKENLRLDFLVVEADVRFTNYYMDLEAKFSPVEAAWESIKAEEIGIEDHVSKPQAFVDGISIYGHRLFGSAPSEPTYVCNWDFDVGRVSGECSSDFVRILLQAVRCFSFTLDDDENALPKSHSPMIHDITFLSARIGNINLWFPLEEIAIQLAAGGLEVTFNDWAGKSFSNRLRLEIPDIQLAAIDQKGAIRRKNQMHSTTPTHALLQLSILLRMVERKRDFAQERQLQQQHVQFHDQRTRRTDWLLDNSSEMIQPHEQLRRTMPNPPAMPIPPMPAPLFNKRNNPSIQIMESQSRRVTSKSRLRHKTSFFSKASPHFTPSLRSAENISDFSDRKANQPSSNQSSDSASRATRVDAVQPPLMPATASSRQDTQGAPLIPPTLKSDIPYCSPWTEPYFRLQNVSPDIRNLPDKTPSDNLATETRKPGGDAPATFKHIDSDNQIVYTMFDVDLGSTVRGFASPTFIAAIASLIKDLQPARPTDLLDDLQIGTMSQIRKIVDARTKLGHITDFCARLPSAQLRILDSGSPVQAPSNEANLDQYDLQLGKFQLTARSSTIEKGVDKNFKAAFVYMLVFRDAF